MVKTLTSCFREVPSKQGGGGAKMGKKKIMPTPLFFNLMFFQHSDGTFLKKKFSMLDSGFKFYTKKLGMCI